MRIGGSVQNAYASVNEWLAQVKELDYSAVIFPVDHTAPRSVRQEYLTAIRDHDLVTGEVGIWKNTLSRDPAEKEKNLRYALGQLELAEEVGANCCVNISGSCGAVWDGYYEENYSKAVYEEIITQTQQLIDTIQPKHTSYTLEPMPWMMPSTPQEYLQLIRDVDRPAFQAHLDFANMINSFDKYRKADAFIAHCFELLSPYIRSVHCKDVLLSNGSLPCVIQEQRVGQGKVDMQKVLLLTEALGPETTLFVEHLDTHAEYMDSVRYLRGEAEKCGVVIK